MGFETLRQSLLLENSVSINKNNINNEKLYADLKEKQYIVYFIDDKNSAKDLSLLIKNVFSKDLDMQNKVLVIDSNKYITTAECLDLFDIQKQCEEHGMRLKIKDGTFWNLEDILLANKKMNDLVDKIQNARVPSEGNRKLNQMEKFLWIYSFVSNRTYHENDLDSERSRKLTSIINNGQDIVCVGFASLLKELCSRVGIECYINSCSVIDKDDEKRNKDYHVNNIVVLDNKVYYCDACWDCISEKNQKHTYNFCLLPVEDVKSMKKVDIMDCSAPFYDIENDLNLIKKYREELLSTNFNDFAFSIKTIKLTRKYEKIIKPYTPDSSEKKDDKSKFLYIFNEIEKLIKTKELGKGISVEDFHTALENIYEARGKSKDYASELINATINECPNIFDKNAHNGFSVASKSDLLQV